MNKEQFHFIALSYQLPIQEGRLKDIGTTHLLFTVDKLPSWWTILVLKGVDKTFITTSCCFKCGFLKWLIPLDVVAWRLEGIQKLLE